MTSIGGEVRRPDDAPSASIVSSRQRSRASSSADSKLSAANASSASPAVSSGFMPCSSETSGTVSSSSPQLASKEPAPNASASTAARDTFARAFPFVDLVIAPPRRSDRSGQHVRSAPVRVTVRNG